MNKIKLIGLLDSPFVRRVAITLHLYDIHYEHEELSVFRHADTLAHTNPYTTAPSVVLEDGTLLLDSAAILDWLDGQVGPTRALMPAIGLERRAVLQILARALLSCEKVGQLYRELGWRPEALHYEKAISRFRGQIVAVHEELEALAQARSVGQFGWLVGERMTQADITVAVMVRFTHYYDKTLAIYGGRSYPALDALSARLEQLPAFLATGFS